jgi:hypothetical protein
MKTDIEKLMQRLLSLGGGALVVLLSEVAIAQQTAPTTAPRGEQRQEKVQPAREEVRDTAKAARTEIQDTAKTHAQLPAKFVMQSRDAAGCSPMTREPPIQPDIRECPETSRQSQRATVATTAVTLPAMSARTWQKPAATSVRLVGNFVPSEFARVIWVCGFARPLIACSSLISPAAAPQHKSA